MEPTDTASKSTSHGHNKALYKSGEELEKLDRKVDLSLVTIKEQDPKWLLSTSALLRETILS